jgi:replicative DNA helicase
MLETCGGIDYLKYLKDSQYYVENLKEYISLLVKHYKRRRLVRMLNNLDSSTIPVDRVDNLVYELKNFI